MRFTICAIQDLPLGDLWLGSQFLAESGRFLTVCMLSPALTSPSTASEWVLLFAVLYRKLRQAQLAQVTGLDQTYISLLERGLRQPTLPTLYRLCKALDIPLDELIKKIESQANSPT